MKFFCQLATAFSYVFFLLFAGCVARPEYGADASIAAKLQSQGRLRLDAAPLDAPFSRRDLLRNFRDIALFYEAQLQNGRIVHRPIGKPVQKWSGPIGYKLIGDDVQQADVAEVEALLAELAGLTGLRFMSTSGTADMLISIASPEGRQEISRYLEGQTAAYRRQYEVWRRTPSWVCGVTLDTAPSDRNVLKGAHVFIGSETTGIMRRLCLHEEITQSLGLTNDSGARPSIFNDDQEFALLTDHDRVLLRTLYDPRLKPGMLEAEAMPLVERIIGEIVASERTGASEKPKD